MNITIITSSFPYPLTSGGAQAQFNMIDRIRKIHDITLIYIENRNTSKKNIMALQSMWPDVRIVTYPVIRQLTYPRYVCDKAVRAFKLLFMSHNVRFIVERALKPYGIYFTKDLVGFINDTITRHNTDIIQVEFFQCLHLVNYLPQNIKKIFIHHEIRFIRNQRLLSHIKLTRKETKLFETVKQQEIDDLNKYDTVVTLTDTDKNILSSNNVKSDIVVSPAAVNTAVKNYNGWNNRIVFLGGYGHKPNAEGLDWFINNVASAIDWTKYNQVELHMIGNGWPASVIQHYKESTKLPITYHGFVEDLSSVAYGAIMIVPILTGSGMRMKILEAASLGMPFITTSVGVEGLNFKDNDSCFIGDTPAEWKDKLERLMSCEELRKQYTSKALKVFQNNYSIDALSKRRAEIYKQH